MDQDAAYALIGVGIAIGGATIGRAALDDLLSTDKAARKAERQAYQARAKKSSVLDKMVSATVIGVSVASLALKLYSWYSTGKPPAPGEIVG